MSPPADGEEDAPGVGSADGLLLLGVLHEAVIELSSRRTGAFWSDVCTHVRWLVPATRVCAVVAAEGGGARLKAAFERGEPVSPPDELPEGHPLVRMTRKTARLPRWFDEPWPDGFVTPGLGSWLVADGMSSVLAAPVRTHQSTLGTLLFSIKAKTSRLDRSMISGLTGIYGLFGGLAGAGEPPR